MASAQQEIEVAYSDDRDPRTRSTLTDLVGELGGILERAQKELEELETVIQIADHLLEMLQPHAPGKIRIVWWRKQKTNELTPVFVQLTVGKGGRWYLKAVATKNVHKLVRRTKGFEVNHAQIYRTVVLAKELLRRRGKLLGLIRQHMQAINNTFQSDAMRAIFAELREIYAAYSASISHSVARSQS